MRLLRKLDARSAAAGGYVAAIGGFDGIHLGHRALIARARELAAAAGMSSMVLRIRIGSAAIRSALAAGDLALAAGLLGRPYAMRGRVIAGDRLGRTLGFPTANLRLARRRTPLAGIFAVRVRGIEAGRSLGGVASLGTRPTVGGREYLLETHVFDYSGDLYGRELEVEFVARLRDELRFADLDTMIAQMHRDAAAARAALAGD